MSKGVDVISGLLRGVEDRFPGVTSWLKGIPAKVASPFKAAGSWLYSGGRDVISGMLNGIRDEKSGIGSWVKKWVVDPVVNWVKHWFGIRSPSTVMAGIGGHIMGGLFQGMSSANLTGVVQAIFGSLPTALGAIVGKGMVSLTSLPGKALNALGGLGSSIANLLGLGGGGGGNSSAQTIGKTLAAARGWTGAQWQALVDLWNRESGWRWNATNPSSGAYGIPQALPADKMASAGKDWRTNPWTQIRWGLSYIAGRYGSPLGAWAHEEAVGWYGHGGKFRAGQLIGVGDRGRELLQFDQPGRVYSPEQSQRMLGGGNQVVNVSVNHVPGYSTPSDVKNAIGVASRQLRLARR